MLIFDEMKAAFAILLILFFCRVANAQVKPDTTITTYLKANNYVLLTDSANLPLSIQKHYTPIKKYLVSKIHNLGGSYVACSYITDNDKTLSFPIEEISGIRLLKKLDEARLKERDSLINGKGIKIQHVNSVAGNPSGRDGLLTLNKATGKITFGIFQ